MKHYKPGNTGSAKKTILSAIDALEQSLLKQARTLKAQKIRYINK